MRVIEALSRVRQIEITQNRIPVESTVAAAFQRMIDDASVESEPADADMEAGIFQIFVADENFTLDQPVPDKKEWAFFQIDSAGNGRLIASRPNLLYSAFCRLREEWLYEDAERYKNGKLMPAAFKWHRVNFDYFSAHLCRTIRKLDLTTYARELARQGYTHWEVNGIAAPLALEEGVYYEVYPRFYTYAPGLDQFVESRLIKGTYPREYLEANLNLMKRKVEIGLRYGLKPGIQCFEPRSLPEKFFQKYPFLRGPRVDHPFRSQKPRFALTLAHPAAREHYTELVENLLSEVPELDYIKIISNDSGAGFEFTKSLYVGANGGAYLIREWKPDRDIAEAAAMNAMRFLRLLRDAASSLNPEFRIITHLEPFYTERAVILRELGDRIDIEGGSFLGTGWDTLDSPYHHPNYEDVREIIGTAFHTSLDKRERAFIDKMAARDTRCHISYSHGFVHNFEPVLGLPFPWLTYEKLKTMAESGIEYAGHSGGIAASTHAPWYINQEILREFHLNPKMNIDEFIHRMADRWVGSEFAGELIDGWKLFEKAYRAYPPMFLYSGFGHVWYKLWIRPIIPNIEAISEADRAYYEDFMLTTPHNPTRVDFNRDVLFVLSTPEHARNIMQRIDANVFDPLTAAIAQLEKISANAEIDASLRGVFEDQRDRMLAFKCWIRTLRNVAAWIAGVHTYLDVKDPEMKKTNRALVHDMVLDEIENAEELLNLWETSQTEFMIVSGTGETTFIYGESIGEKIKRKIELMRGREDDEPYIDPNFMWRVPGYEMRRMIG
ncbi:hypothetical protein JXJ21_26535 [candidate division KSB1 bacterium]|nr:hypothetical protein [candidate division KSB1 bacterium]